ncbi:thioester reductase domain-containing protein, partial [Candidatus Frankia nodulisporulans]|uniref:thioester reductase domain-containing protein n=1 Tax=Candidatus Frankia nodulisporulans TaxID=2060052 RepID=UPI0037049B49
WGRPADHARPAVPSHLAESHPFGVAPDVSVRLRELARAQGATPYMLMLTAFKVLLHRYSGETDLIVGSAAHGRDRPETAGLIGYFANTLVMRTDLSADPTFAAALARVRDTCLDALRHRSAPFESVVADLAPGRDAAENPVFAVSLVQQRLPEDARMGDLSVTLAGRRIGVTQSDIVVHVWERGDLIEGMIVGARDLFRSETVARMAGHLETLLTAAAQDPERRLSALPLLTAAETDDAFAQEHATDVPTPSTALGEGADTVLARLTALAGHGADLPALRLPGAAPMSRRTLLAEVTALRDRLAAAGATHGTRIGVAVHPAGRRAVALLAAAATDGSCVPLPPPAAGPAEPVGTDMGDTLLVVDGPADGEPFRVLRTSTPGWEPASSPLDAVEGARLVRLADWLWPRLAPSGSTGGSAPGVGARPSEPAGTVRWTGGLGTVGDVHETMVPLLAGATLLAYPTDPAAPAGGAVPAGGVAGGWVVGFSAAGPVEPAAAADPGTGQVTVVVDDVLPRRAAEAYLASTSGPVHFLFAPHVSGGPVSLTRVEATGGSPAAPPAEAVSPGRAGNPGENVPVGTDRLGALRVVDDAAGLAPIGVTGPLLTLPALAHTGLRGRRLADGRIDLVTPRLGRVTVAGYRLDLDRLAGRLRGELPSLTDVAFSVARDSTGRAHLTVHVVPAAHYDGPAVLAAVRAVLPGGGRGVPGLVVPVTAIPRRLDGTPDLDLLDRLPLVDRDLLRRWQDTLAALPGVTGAAVMVLAETGAGAGTEAVAGAGAEVATGTEAVAGAGAQRVCGLLTVHGFVTVDDPASTTPPGWASSRVSDRRGTPTTCTVTVVDGELPRTDEGPDLAALARLLEAGSAAATTAAVGTTGTGRSTTPASGTEAEIAAIWQAVLRLDTIGVDDDFFDLGGHSLRAAEVIITLGERLGVRLPMTAMFETPTVAGLAAAVERHRATPLASVDPVSGARRDAVLASDITADGTRPYDETTRGAPREVLLTGATGFLGAFLLAELLRRTDARVHCLVRATDPTAGLDRLRATLTRYRHWDEAFAARIVAVPGDLGRPGFGLRPADLDELAATLDLIVHNGASVSMIAPYESLRAANVDATTEVLRLAARVRVKPVHYVSTVGVAIAAHGNPPLLTEDRRVDPGQLEPGGYPLSKWVAEELAAQAAARGLPVAVYRPGRVSGDSRTGVGTTDDVLWSYVQAVVQTGVVPDDASLRGLDLGLVPVDYVVAALVELALTRPATGTVYHLTNPRPTLLGNLLDRLGALGYPSTVVSEQAWREALRVAAATARSPAIATVRALEAAGPRGDEASGRYRFDDHNTRTALDRSGLRCPTVDDTVVDRYLTAAVDSGFLPDPGRRAP